MEKFTLIKPVTFNPGSVLGLTEEQSSVRMHNLRKVGSGKFEVVNPIQFKVGEVVGHDGALPKSMANAIEAADKPAAKKEGAAAKPKAEPKPAAKKEGQEPADQE